MRCRALTVIIKIYINDIYTVLCNSEYNTVVLVNYMYMCITINKSGHYCHTKTKLILIFSVTTEERETIYKKYH